MPDEEPPDAGLARREIAASALEAARVEVCRRLRVTSLPTSLEFPRLVVTYNPVGTGWTSSWEEVSRSSLNASEVAFAIHDDSVVTKMLGLRRQLSQVAAYLAGTTHLGAVETMGLLPGVGGTEGALVRYVQPLAYEYLLTLDDVDKADPELRDRLLGELDEVCSRPTKRRFRRQFALTGLLPTEALGPYRGVELRPLTGIERGRIAAEQQRLLDRDHPRDGGFVPVHPVSPIDPRCLLDIVSERDRKEITDSSELPAKVLLAFYLSGFTIGSSGSSAAFEEPRWASFGVSSVPVSIPDRWVHERRPVSRDDFEAVVRLAHRIPDFGSGEGSARDVALYRCLQGFNSRESGFLDFAIGLEAALLSALKTKTELAYRFSLYGSLFLRDDRDPATTFAQFKRVYDTRSKLVHGSRVKPAERNAAEADATELARAVIRKAVEEAWPEPAKLDRLALGS